jgi:hypothetical protein
VWEERPSFAPPASPEAVTVFERTAGFPLPEDFRAFLATTGAVAGLSVHNGYSLGGLEGLARWLRSGTLPRAVAGEPAAPVGSDGCGNGFLLSRGGRVCRWDHETGEVTPVATSFAEFLDRVARDWAAYIADTPGWAYLV